MEAAEERCTHDALEILGIVVEEGAAQIERRVGDEDVNSPGLLEGARHEPLAAAAGKDVRFEDGAGATELANSLGSRRDILASWAIVDDDVRTSAGYFKRAPPTDATPCTGDERLLAGQ